MQVLVKSLKLQWNFKSVEMLFQVVVKNFDGLGINPKQAKKPNPINLKIFVGFVGLFFNALFQILHIVNEAQGFQDYIQTIYMASIGTVGFLVLATIVFKMDDFFRFIECCDDILIQAENDKDIDEFVPHLLGVLKNTIKNVEKWSEIIYFVVVKLTTVCGMAPRVIVSLYFYYIEDLGEDSFELPLSMW